MKPDVPNDIRAKLEAALLCLNGGANALDAYDMEAVADCLADACDVLVSVIGDYDIVLTDKHKALIIAANEEVEKL